MPRDQSNSSLISAVLLLSGIYCHQRILTDVHVRRIFWVLGENLGDAVFINFFPDYSRENEVVVPQNSSGQKYSKSRILLQGSSERILEEFAQRNCERILEGSATVGN